MHNKKIAIFGIKYFPSKGGASRVVESLLWGLKDHYDITIYCFKHDKAYDNIPGVRVIQFSEIPIKGIGVFMYYLRCCLHLMVRGNYDLIHVHKTDAAFFLPLLERKFNVVTTSHALPYHNDKWNKFGKSYFRMAERIFMHSKGAVTSISKKQVKYYSETYNRTVNYIPNGINLEYTISQQKAELIIKKHNVTSNYILFAARRLIPLKGCHTLIEALKQIKFKGTLIVSADKDQLPSYTKQLIKKALNINVKFIGYVADRGTLNSLIQGADLFVFPSEIEGMSMMLLEVALIGTPLICSDIPQNKDVLSDDEVLYFKSKNINDLSEKLQWAFKNKDKMKALATKAMNKIEQEYKIDHIVQRYIELYNKTMLSTEPEQKT